MGLISPIAGAYTATWNSNALGLTDEGFELQAEPKEQAINRSDQYGDSTLDAIVRGGDWFMQWTNLVYGANPLGAVWPFAAFGLMGVIGRSAVTSVCQALVLTSTASTPAAATPATLTAASTKLAANANPRFLFDSRLRNVPIRMQLYPYLVSSNPGWFSTT